MPIISISEAARLTGKARSTIQSYIKTGKISKTTDNHTGNIGVETSELLRVFGKINIQNATDTTYYNNVAISQQTTSNTTDENIKILQLKSENERLKAVLDSKQETIDSLKTALKLLEYRQEKTEAVPPKETQTASEPPQNTSTALIEPPTPSTGFWGGFKKLFR